MSSSAVGSECVRFRFVTDRQKYVSLCIGNNKERSPRWNVSYREYDGSSNIVPSPLSLPANPFGGSFSFALFQRDPSVPTRWSLFSSRARNLFSQPAPALSLPSRFSLSCSLARNLSLLWVRINLESRSSDESVFYVQDGDASGVFGDWSVGSRNASDAAQTERERNRRECITQSTEHIYDGALLSSRLNGPDKRVSLHPRASFARRSSSAVLKLTRLLCFWGAVASTRKSTFDLGNFATQIINYAAGPPRRPQPEF